MPSIDARHPLSLDQLRASLPVSHLRGAAGRLAAWSRVRGRPALGLAGALAALGALALVATSGRIPLPSFSISSPGRVPVQELTAETQPGAPSLHWARDANPVTGSNAQAPSSDLSAPPWGRRVVRRAALDLELADVDQGVSRLVELVESLGGFVSGTESHTDPRGTLGATVVAQVPPERFTRALSALDGLGRVTSRRMSGQDVSEEFVDLEARIRNLERHERQLLGFMERAQKVSDLLSLETELTRVRGEIERASGRLQFLRARVDMATIQVGLTRTPSAAPSDLYGAAWKQIRVAFLDGWHWAFGLAVAAAALAAQLSPLVLPVAAGWTLYRCCWAPRRRALAPPSAPAGL